MKATLIRVPEFSWLTVVALAFCSASLFGQNVYWTQTSAPSNQWASVGSSSDGTKLVAVVYGGGIYTSSNSGIRWTQQTSAPSKQWLSVGSSSDGTKLVAVVYGGGIYTSSDSGVTWTQQTSAPNSNWRAVASSSDGTKLVAMLDYCWMYTSINSGVTWTEQTGWQNTYWTSVASSSNGTKLVAVTGTGSGGGIYTSGNSGVTWTPTSAPNKAWASVASSSDGTKLMAVVAAANGGIYTSSNSGGTWTPQTNAPSKQWQSVASSSDGTKLVAGINGGGIYVSVDSGVTWTQTGPPNKVWASSLASSSDGTKLVAVDAYGGIFTDIMPWITQQSESVLSCPGSSPTFAVTASGTAPLYFQWRKNGTNLVDGGHVTGSATTSLTLLNVSQTDTANYDLVVTNAYGSVTSSVGTLTVTLIPARATPIVLNGFIVGATLLDGGCGYSSPPAIVFSGQGGSNATAYAQISNGTVTNIGFTSAGSGYPANTALLIAPPIYSLLAISKSIFNPSPATATPIITNGFVIGANLTAGGTDYTQVPSVSFSDVSGHGATACAQINNGSVTRIVITSAGSGYSANTLLNISAPPSFEVVVPSASNLMAGQTYQLRVASGLNTWTSYGAAFTATNTTWTPSDTWNVAITNSMFFRLQMFQ